MSPVNQLSKGAVYQRGVVACRRCGSKIHVQRLSTLSDEFSVRCAKCGHRDFYLRREIVIEEMPERRKRRRS